MQKTLLAIAVTGLVLNIRAQTSFNEERPPIVKFTTTNEAVRARAKYLVRAGVVTITMDRVNESLSISRTRNDPALEPTNYVCLSAYMPKGGKPSLSIHAVHFAGGWIFANRVEFKTGNSTVTLADHEPARSVLSGGVVWELLCFLGDTKDSQTVIKAVVNGQCKLCALRGKEGDVAVKLSREDFADVLMVYYALGGAPLNATD
jgi:hypothetical protein